MSCFDIYPLSVGRLVVYLWALSGLSMQYKLKLKGLLT